MSKPILKATWATANITDPGSGQANKIPAPSVKETNGWVYLEKPPFNWYNSWMNTVFLWLEWVEEIAEDDFTFTGIKTFDDGVIFEENIQIKKQALFDDVIFTEEIWAKSVDGLKLRDNAGVLAFQVFDDGDSKIYQNLTIEGNLIVNGTKIIENVSELQVEDNVILINKGEVGAGVTYGYAGLHIDRGTADWYGLLHRESDDSGRYGIFNTLSDIAQAGGASSITLAASSSAVDDFYNLMKINIIDGTGKGQTNVISDYTGSSKIASVSSAWSTNPDDTSKYEIILLDDTQALATRENTPTSAGVLFWNNTAKRLDTDAEFLYNPTTNILTVNNIRPVSDSAGSIGSALLPFNVGWFNSIQIGTGVSNKGVITFSGNDITINSVAGTINLLTNAVTKTIFPTIDSVDALGSTSLTKRWGSVHSRYFNGKFISEVSAIYEQTGILTPQAFASTFDIASYSQRTYRIVNESAGLVTLNISIGTAPLGSALFITLVVERTQAPQGTTQINFSGTNIIDPLSVGVVGPTGLYLKISAVYMYVQVTSTLSGWVRMNI